MPTFITFGAAVSASGINVLCPELADSYWYDGISAPVLPSRVVSDQLAIEVRTVAEEGGSATAQVAIEEDGTTGTQVQLVRTGVWDVVLVDSFQDDLCPGIDPGDAISANRPVFFGDTAGRILRLNRGHQELGTPIQGFLRPNVIAPAGIGATCLFRNVYVALEATTGGTMTVTPVLDGEVLTAEAISFVVPAPADGTRGFYRIEVPLSRAYEISAVEQSRAGLMGTWFTVEVDVQDNFGCGRIVVAGIEVEYDPHDEGVPGPTFTGESLTAALPVDPKAWYFAGNGSGIYKGAQGTDDAGSDVLVRFRTNEIAPAGVGGEAMFEDVELAVTRFNAVDWTFTATPVVDGVELEGQDITLAGVGSPVTELVPIDFSQPYMVGGVERSRYYPRGAWFALLITATAAPDKDVIIEGMELEYDIVEESVEDITNA